MQAYRRRDPAARREQLASQGIVKVDGLVELRKTAKIRAGQVVECLGHRILVKAA